MEFIPLERYSGKGTRRGREDEDIVQLNKKKSKQNDGERDIATRKLKPKPQPKLIEKKNVKNKYREALEFKRKEKISKKCKKILKKGVDSEEEDVQPKKKRKVNFAAEEEEDEDEDDEGDEDKNEQDEEEDNKEDSKLEEEEESEEENNEDIENQNEEELDSEEIAFQKKCKELDEKKKNRLFVKLKKKIYSEAQIKELHPDIKGVVFPRKKNSRWCWAVFISEEKANEALKILRKNKQILVNKPDPHEKVIMRLKDKMVTIKRKKEGRKKLEKMWM